MITLNYPRTTRYTAEVNYIAVLLEAKEVNYIAGLLEAHGYSKEVTDLKTVVEYLDSDAETLEECFHELIDFIEKLIEGLEMLMAGSGDKEAKLAKVRKLIEGWKWETRLVEDGEEG